MEVGAVDRASYAACAHIVPSTHTTYSPASPQTRSKTVFGENAGAGAAGKAKATTSGRHFGTQLSTNQQQVMRHGVDRKMKVSTAAPLATRRAAPVAAPEPVHPRQFIEQIHPADINDLENSQCAVDYVDDIYKYWKQCEVRATNMMQCIWCFASKIVRAVLRYRAHFLTFLFPFSCLTCPTT